MGEITAPAGESTALPPYSVRTSSRARRVRLTVSVREGLVVTLPVGVPAKAAERAVRERAEWARRHLEATADRRAAISGPPDALLPSLIELAAFAEVWPIEYRETASARVSARTSGAAVLVSGATHDAAACLAALRRWRDRVARERLPVLLAEVSSATGIGYGRVSVRGQRTRWGSCSGTGSISLNRNLVFLPEHLVRYVLAHELAHVRARHHGPAFWTLLEEIAPGSAHRRECMKTAGDLVPGWAHD